MGMKVGLGRNTKEYPEELLCGDEMGLCRDCGGGYINLYLG